MWIFICAAVTRLCFILVSLVGVFTVCGVKNDRNYWLLTLLFLPQVAEMIITLKWRGGKDYRWFSPAIFLFLISIIPSIWILELHHKQKSPSEPGQCQTLPPSLQIIVDRTLENSTAVQEYIKQLNSSLCAKDWTLTLHMILLILLILGKWLLPRGGGFTRDELSQLLVIFVGTAGDILEFTDDTPTVLSFQVYVILAVWTWSMLQFPLNLAVVNTKPEDEENPDLSLMTKYSKDLWTIVQALFIQDGPFLVVRLIVLIYFKGMESWKMLIFFAIKNSLVVVLNLYRLILIYQDYRSSTNH